MKLLKIARKNLLDILPSHLKEIFDFKKIREFSKSVLRTDVNQEAIEQNTDLVKALKLLVNVTEKLEYLLNTIEVDPKRLLCLAWQNLHLKLLLLPEMAIVDKASAKVDFASVCIDLNKSRLAFKYLKEAQRDLVNFSAEELETNPFIKELISIQKIHLLLDRDEVDLSRVPKLLRNIARRIGKINPKNLHVHCLLVDADYYCALKQYHLIDNDANKKLLIRKANNLLTFHDQWIRRPSKSIMELHNLLADLADKSHKPKLARQHRREAIKIGDYLLEAN